MTKVQTNAQGKVYVVNGKALLATTPGVTYPGLATSYANGLATINKGALQDYKVSYVNETGCLAEYVHTCNNFRIFGAPTINFASGAVSGFSYDNYIQLPQSVPTSTYCSTYDIIFQASLTSASDINSLLSRPSDLKFIGTNWETSTYSIYIGGSSFISGTTVLENNKKYWFRAIFDGTNCKGYLLADDDYVLSSLPDISQWSYEWTTTTDIFRGQQLVIGRNYGQSTQYFRGTVNLSQAIIYVNGEEWWSGRGNSAIVYNNTYNLTKALLMGSSISSELNIFYNPVYNDYFLTSSTVVPAYSIGNKVYRCSYGGTIDVSGYSNYPCYSISPNWGIVSNGSLTYNSSDMSYSGFNQNNYIRTNYNFEMSTAQFAAGFCVQVHFKFDSGWNNRHNFILSGDGNWLNYSYIAVLSDGKAEFRLASGGSGLFIMNGTTAMQQGVEYWLRVIKPDYYTAPRMELSTDGENWTLEATGATSISADISNNNLRVGDKDNSWYLMGRLYLDGTFIDFYPISATGTTERVWSLIK